MTVPAARRASPAAPAPRPALRRPRRPGADVLVGALALVTGLVVFGWRLGVPSPWRDEAVTVAVASRSTSQILDLVASVDLVHAPFYLLVHLLFGDTTTTTQARAVSAVAAAATAPVLHGLTRRLALAGPRAVPPAVARWAGVAAAGTWLATPFVSRYAQEARPYALAALVATLATYLLVRAGTSTGRARRGWLAGYAAALPVLASLNTVALLVGLSHAAWVLTRRERRGPLLAAAAGLAVAAPLLVAQHAQAGQVAFLRRPGAAELTGHVEFALGSTAGVVVTALAAALVLRWGRVRAATLLALCWGVLPVPLLWLVSQVTPFWTTRYLVFVAPGTCLLVGLVATVALPRVPGRLAVRVAAGLAVAVVAGTAVSGLRMQGVFRDPRIGHGEDLRGTAALIASAARPGDGLLFLPDGEYRYRVLTQLYPEAFAGLDDLALTRSATASATLVGETVPADGVAAAVGTTPRVWVVGGPGPVVTAGAADAATAELLVRDYRLVSDTELRAFSVRLYERR